VGASNVSDLLQRASAADSDSDARVAGFRLQQALNELELLTRDFDPRLRALMVEAIAKLRPFAVGNDSVPALRLREIALITEGTKLLSENAALSKGLRSKWKPDNRRIEGRTDANARPFRGALQHLVL
jgi:hypothetical protein